MLMRFVAAKDQTYQAVLVAAGQPVDLTGDGRIRAVKHCARDLPSDVREKLLAWMVEPIVDDATELRNASMHDTYSKSLQPDQQWHVEPPRRARPAQPRDLESYGERIAAHAKAMHTLLPNLRRALL